MIIRKSYYYSHTFALILKQLTTLYYKLSSDILKSMTTLQNLIKLGLNIILYNKIRNNKLSQIISVRSLRSNMGAYNSSPMLINVIYWLSVFIIKGYYRKGAEFKHIIHSYY